MLCSCARSRASITTHADALMQLYKVSSPTLDCCQRLQQVLNEAGKETVPDQKSFRSYYYSYHMELQFPILRLPSYFLVASVALQNKYWIVFWPVVAPNPTLQTLTPLPEECYLYERIAYSKDQACATDTDLLGAKAMPAGYSILRGHMCEYDNGATAWNVAAYWRPTQSSHQRIATCTSQ
jgi:hypothetical protein